MATRCSPKRLQQFASNLNAAQKQAIIEIGLGGLLSIQCTYIRHDLCAWLARRFDPQRCAFNLYGKWAKFSPQDVTYILGLQFSGTNVVTTGTKANIEDLCTSIYDGQPEVSLKHLSDRLRSSTDASDDFIRMSVLYMIACMLRPSMQITLTVAALHSVADVASLRHTNWCKFVFDGVIEGIQKFQSSARGSLGGCLLVLMVTLLIRDVFVNVYVVYNGYIVSYGLPVTWYVCFLS